MKIFSKSIAVLLLSAAVLQGCSDRGGKIRYVKHAEFPEGASLEEKTDIAAHLVPTPQQLAWQQRELTAFLHFGINTFTDREWGNGRENPALFNPAEFDALQWITTLKECGFEMAIITAKHHDGFCLWPTATTAHSVAASPWRDGKGDVVAEISRACAETGMKFGVYLSPWDRNAECYGDSPRYNEMFVAQLTELLTNYGPVAEVWFDGACGEGPNGRRQEYDWTAYLDTIHKLQPEAVVAIMGDDVRWVGNENGKGRETEWSATVLPPACYERAASLRAAAGVTANKDKDLGSRERLAAAREIFWYPSEVDVSIRPGWFWHERENAKVKTLKQLVDIYFESVGRNSVLLLNIPPDSRGLLNAADSVRLCEMHDWLDRTFARNLVAKGDRGYRIAEGKSVTYKLEKESVVDIVMLCEKIEEGQRIEAFTVEVQTADGWQEAARGTTVGHKRLLRIEPVEARALRIRIDSSRAEALLSGVGAFRSNPIIMQFTGEDERMMSRDGRTVLETEPLAFDLGEETELVGFVYTPLSEMSTPDTAVHYIFSVSADGKEWTPVAEGEFGNILNNPVAHTVEFGDSHVARYIRFEGSAFSGESASVSPDELDMLRAIVEEEETE